MQDNQTSSDDMVEQTALIELLKKAKFDIARGRIISSKEIRANHSIMV
jgi:hypothetical protein